jgi:hypothetical protein
MHFGAGQIERLRDLCLGFPIHASEGVLHVMQDRQQRAFHTRMSGNQPH